MRRLFFVVFVCVLCFVGATQAMCPESIAEYLYRFNGLLLGDYVQSKQVVLLATAQDNGQVTVARWVVPGVPTPIGLISDADAKVWYTNVYTKAVSAKVQTAKSTDLKLAENQFLLLCEFLSGSKAKLGFPELKSCIAGIQTTNAVAAINITLELLAEDSELKRLAGNTWWDTVAWHPEIVGP